VRGYVGTTDYDWFNSSERVAAHEVKFWQPSARGFNAPPGTPFSQAQGSAELGCRTSITLKYSTTLVHWMHEKHKHV
jgi:hypothetical protein